MSLAKILEKFLVIDGDVGKIEAGISATDRQIIVNNVSFIYHLSASINFELVSYHKYEVFQV